MAGIEPLSLVALPGNMPERRVPGVAQCPRGYDDACYRCPGAIAERLPGEVSERNAGGLGTGRMMDTMSNYWMVFLWLFAFAAWPQTDEVALSRHLAADTDLNTDPDSTLWKDAPAVLATVSAKGEPSPGHHTEIRSRWTKDNLYLFFICPYQQLYFRPELDTQHETNRLWNYDVAEVFVGADFEKIWQYREFQVSPRGEWVDLDIDRKEPKPEGGWLWNSGFKVAARIDEAHKIWYGAMKIPILSITDKPVGPGFQFRTNFYRIQGPPPNRVFVAWKVTGGNHHIPEKFGLLKLIE
jgi:hypothetical protein